jgi:hypothetical protein
MDNYYNSLIKRLCQTGGFRYINDRVPPNADPEHAFVLNTLIRQVTVDSNNNMFSGFYSLLYDESMIPVPPEEAETYNSNALLCLPIAINISRLISEELPSAIGRVLIFEATDSIIYDSFANNNTLENARLKEINQFSVGGMSFIMTANMSERRIGHGILRSPSSNYRTVYVAHALGPFGYNDMTVVYCVYWVEDTPNFLKI